MVANLEAPAAAPDFLAGSGWERAQVLPLAGDASFRRYFRVVDGARSAILMDAPPPREDPRPFLEIAGYLREKGFRAPEILAAKPEQGLVLLEDFGLQRMREFVDENPHREHAIYRQAIDVLIDLRRCEAAPVRPYDLAEYLREAELFTQWYCPAGGLVTDESAFRAVWKQALAPVLERQPPVTVLRDYHAENLMLLEDGGQGLLDFQDALAGHPAYDLVSLLQDARRDVSPDLEVEMLEYYASHSGDDPGDLAADYAILGAQRNMKIVGIFVRLWKRDGKPRYLDLIPRVWRALERDLEHPALAPVQRWFDREIPKGWRANDGMSGGIFAA